MNKFLTSFPFLIGCLIIAIIVIIAVASGEKSKSEVNGYGDDEFNPWIIDPTL